MADKDYYLVLPLLLYGLAISDLVNSWRSFFLSERRYWPYILTSLLLLEVAFWNFFRMNEWMTESSFSTYLSYSRFIITPLVFILVVAVFTPDRETEDIKAYFDSNMRIIYGGLAVFVALHFMFVTPGEMPRIELTTRVGMIALLLLIAMLKKPGLVYLLAALHPLIYYFVG
jgi:hypothetical protein